MYATAIGLVLSGFMARDMREERYQESMGRMKRDRHGRKFFSNIIQKTKDLLIDDFDDKEYR
jgi:cell division protein FtsA